MKMFLLIFIMFFIPLLKAQAPDTIWTKAYHRGSYDHCNWIEETSDGGFVLVGQSVITGNTWEDIFLVRTNQIGEPLWTYIYGDTIIGQNAYCIKEDFEGGFIIAGVKNLTMSVRNAWIIKTDSNGDTLWTYKYGGDKNAEAKNVSFTSDSGYIITGFKSEPGHSADVFLLKLDNNGEFKWVKNFGSSYYEEGLSVQQTIDGGYMVAGSKNASGRSSDFYLIKTNSDGDLEWAKTYGGTEYDNCTSAQQTYDGGYIMFGESDSYIVNTNLAIKTNSLGDTLWTKVFYRSNGDYGWSVDQTADSGFIFGGYSNNPGMRDDYWFIRTDGNGDTLWTKTVGYGDDQRGYCVLQSADGGYVLAGSSAQGGSIGSDFYVVKLNPSVTNIDDNDIMLNSFALNQNYPNPFNPSTKIGFTIPQDERRETKNVSLKVYDILGKEVATLIDEYKPAGSYEVEFNTSTIKHQPSSGIYLYQLKVGEFIQTKKMVFLK
jgi:hypothetical protein